MVDGIPIYQSEWDRLAKPYFEEVQARAGRELRDDERKLLTQNVLDELIRERLWLADARRRGMKVTEAAIDARMKQNEFFRTNGQVDEAKFRTFKSSPTSNYRVLRGQIERALLVEGYARWMERRFGPRESELKKAFEQRTSLATIRYFVMGPEAVSLEPEATSAQIRAYYEAHPDEFESADEARIQYIRVLGAAEGAAGDSARAASQAAHRGAVEVLNAIKDGAPAETAAKPHGGLNDSGAFRLGDPIRGLGRSEALTAQIKATEAGQWGREPVRVGPYWVVAKVTERHPARRLLLLEVLPHAKRKADALVRDEVTDSLARAEVRLHPEEYYAPRVTASIVARALSGFETGPPPTPREVARRLERERKDRSVPDTARAWIDSTRAALPERMLSERRLAAAARAMRDAASRLSKKEAPARIAARQAAVASQIQLYRGEPPVKPILVEGALLDTLYRLRPGDVVGPRVARDSVFVVRVEALDLHFLPPYEALRQAARTAVGERRRAQLAREAEAFFAERRGSYHTPTRWVVEYVHFKRAKPDQIAVARDSVAAYWRAHPLEFTEPGRARVRHILIRAERDAPSGAARRKALEVRQRIEAGEDFASVARQVSEDPGSAARGGELGEITRGSVVKAFGDAAFTLPIGALSEPVETEFGVHILLVEDRKPGRLRPLEESREEIHGLLAQARADSTALAGATALARAASQPGASFDSLAVPYGGPKRSGPVAAGGDLPEVGPVLGLSNAVASLPDGGVASEPIALPDGYLVVRRVREVAPEEAPFQEVRERVLADYQMERRRAIADSLNTRFRAALKAGADPDTLFLALGGLRSSRPFSRLGPIPDLPRDLARDSTYLSQIFTARARTLLPPLEGSSATLYAVVGDVVILPPTEFAKQRDTLLRELVDQRVEAWTARLRAKAPIRLHRRDLAALLG